MTTRMSLSKKIGIPKNRDTSLQSWVCVSSSCHALLFSSLDLCTFIYMQSALLHAYHNNPSDTQYTVQQTRTLTKKLLVTVYRRRTI
jgi:hypothetical protein